MSLKTLALVRVFSAALFVLASAPVCSAQNQLRPMVEDLGGGLAGASGIPTCSVSGLLAPGEQVVFSIDGAAPNSVAVLVVGASIANTPAFGGTLIPSADLTLSATTDDTGHGEISVTWSTSLEGTSFWQWGVVDPAAVQGWSLSNAIAVFGNTWTLCNAAGQAIGSLWQSADRKIIRTTLTAGPHAGSMTHWVWNAAIQKYEEAGLAQPDTLTVGGGTPQAIMISGGVFAVATSVK